MCGKTKSFVTSTCLLAVTTQRRDPNSQLPNASTTMTALPIMVAGRRERFGPFAVGARGLTPVSATGSGGPFFDTMPHRVYARC